MPAENQWVGEVNAYELIDKVSDRNFVTLEKGK